MHNHAAAATQHKNRFHRWVVGLVLGTMTAAALTMTIPPPAAAAVHNLFPADVDGFPKGNFRADEALFVTLTSDLSGGKVCVVDATVTNPTTVDCTKPRWGSASTYIGAGTMLGMPFEAPLLPVGRWKLLATDTAGKNGSELSEPFTVVSCSPNCDTSVARAQLQPWKDLANSKIPNVNAQVKNLAVDIATRTYKIVQGYYGGLGFGLAGGLIGAGWAAANFDFVVPDTTDLAKALYKRLNEDVESMYRDIAADPPRDDYDIETLPEFSSLPTLTADSSTTAAQAELLNRYFDTLMRIEAYGKASRLANERYQGAEIDGDHEAAFLQAQATANLTFDLNAQLRELQILQPQVAAMGWAGESIVDAPDGTSPAAHWADVLAEIENLNENGLTPEQRAALLSCDFATQNAGDCQITEAMLDEAEDFWADDALVAELGDIDPNLTLRQTMNEITAGLDAEIAGFDAFARWMLLVAADEEAQMPGVEPNHSPVSAFTASPITGTAPLTVTFTSQATDPDGDSLALRWDLAGARFVDDETTVTHTFTNPGEYWISLVATDPDGLWDQDIQKVTVHPDETGGGETNQAPVASFTPTLVDQVGPFEQTFTSTSTDPDGDPLTHAWYFGDGTVYGGETVTKTFEPGYEMSVLLLVSDGRLTSVASGVVFSRGGAANVPPVASFTADPVAGAAPLEVLFTSTSSDLDGDPLTYTWFFGDGQQASNTSGVVAHTYAFAGTYTATMVVSDGRASASTSQTITVSQATESLTAAYGLSKGYDAVSSMQGGAILDTGVDFQSSNPLTNLIQPNGLWRTNNGVTGEQTIFFDLAGRGRDLIDRVVLTGANTNLSVKTFSVDLVEGDNPFGAATKVIDREELALTNDDQEFAFAAQRARFLKLTVHDNHGGNYVRLSKISVPTMDRLGGLISHSGGVEATVVESSSEHSASYIAARILTPDNNYWSSSPGVTTDQLIRVKLGGEGSHTIDRVRLRGSTSTRSLKDFEVWVSPTGAAGSFINAGEGTLPQDGTLHEFAVTPSVASHVELRLKNNHGDPSYMYLYEFEAVTTDGLNVANGGGVGAELIDVSSVGIDAEYLIAPDRVGYYWQTAMGQSTNQHATVLLRNGESALIDRVLIESGSTRRPRNVEIQVSDDGSSWTTVASRQLENVTGDHWLSFDPVRARQVRLFIRDGWHTDYLRVTRFRVFSVERGAADDVPFVDLSSGNPVAWAWNFGDGSTSTQQHPVHTFPGPGTYPISLTVTDVDGNTETINSTYTVPAPPPIAISAPSFTVDEWSAHTLTAVADARVVQWDWNLDYTKPSTTTESVTARFPDDGTYTVTLRGLTSEGLWTPTFSQQFIVNNVAPTVQLGGPVSGLAGSPIQPIVNRATDPADTITCTWDWGDGSALETVTHCQSTYARVPHTYAVPGTYTATLTADDGDGGVTSASVELTALIRPTFMQISSTSATGDDRDVTARLLDSTTGAPVPGETVQISTAGGASASATTDAQGYATVTLPDAAPVEHVTASFGGSVVFDESAVTLPVRAPRADIVFLVDESGSMAGRQAAIRDNLLTIIRGLSDNLYFRAGLVGYANVENGRGRVMAPLDDDMEPFVSGVNRLVAGGGNANAYEAVVVGSGFTVEGNQSDGALIENPDMVFSSSAASCAVLISDAPVSEVAGAWSKTTREHAEQALASRGTTLFALTVDQQATKDAYGPGAGLAGQTGGQWWDVEDFTRNPVPVLETLVSECITRAATPDLSVAVGVPSPVVGNADFTVTVTATNQSTIYTPSVDVEALVPTGLEFVSAAGGGSYNATTRTVSWPALDLDVGGHADRTMVLRADTSGLAPGDHPFGITATVDYNGSLGVESDLTNNEHTGTVTVQVPEPGKNFDVGVATSTPASVEGGDEVDWTLTVTNHEDPASGVSLVQGVPERFDVTAVVLPGGWTNTHGAELVGAHPDGSTPGTWLVLTGPQAFDGVDQIVVTATVRDLPGPSVVEDQGPLNQNLPALAQVPADEVVSRACVSADLDAVATNNCADLRVPLRDIVAAVTVRLFGGITHLIVSVDTSDSLADDPVSLRWTPGVSGATPDELALADLEVGRHHVIAWPGGTFGANQATAWPGWRPITDTDRDADGQLLDPVTGDVLTSEQLEQSVHGNLILDLTLPVAGWRVPSTVTLTANPSVSVTVAYRELLPDSVVPDLPVVVPDPPAAVDQPAARAELPKTGTGATWMALLSALAFILTGTALLQVRRPRRRPLRHKLRSP